MGKLATLAVLSVLALRAQYTPPGGSGGGSVVLPGSPDKSVQVACSGAFCGDAGLLWDATGKALLINATTTAARPSALTVKHLYSGAASLTNGYLLGIDQKTEADATVSTTGLSVFGAQMRAVVDNGNPVDFFAVEGHYSTAEFGGDGNSPIVVGVGSEADLTGKGTADWLHGMDSFTSLFNNNGAGTATNAADFYALAPFADTGMVLHNHYQFYAETNAGGGDTFNAQFYAAAQGSGANDYGFYQAGAGVKNVFEGTVKIPAIKSTTGTRFVCVDTAGNITSSVTACSGT